MRLKKQEETCSSLEHGPPELSLGVIVEHLGQTNLEMDMPILYYHARIRAEGCIISLLAQPELRLRYHIFGPMSTLAYVSLALCLPISALRYPLP